jgi:hypothetical protein
LALELPFNPNNSWKANLLKAVSEAMPTGLSLYLFLLTDAPHPQL